MQWLPTLSARSQRFLYRHLRQQGLTWHVSHGQSTRMIGVAEAVVRDQISRKSASAAAAFALAHPTGDHALCMEVQSNGIWLVASHDGRLLSQTDCWFVDPSELERVLVSLNSRFEEIKTQRICWSPSDASLPSELAFLSGPPLKSCQFVPVPVNRRYWLIVLAVGIPLLALCLVVWRLSQQRHPTVEPSVLQSEPLKPVLTHQSAAVLSLLSKWQNLSLNPDGWQLTDIRCQIQQAQALCKANYTRQNRSADNEGLISRVPKGWHFEPLSLDRAQIRGNFSMQIKALNGETAVSVRDAITQLQRISARVTDLSISTQASRLSGNSELSPNVFARALQVRLVLREAQQMDQWHLLALWREINLEVVRSAQVNQHSGYLMLDLKGDFFGAQ